MRTLYLSGGSAFGAWQAGLLSEMIMDPQVMYKHIVGASAGSLNAVCIFLSLYEYAEHNRLRGTKSNIEDAKKYVQNNLERLWLENFSIPPLWEHIMRLIFCLRCRGGTLFEHEIRRQIDNFENMFEEGTISGALRVAGSEHHGIFIPKLSIVTKIEDSMNNEERNARKLFYRYSFDFSSFSHIMFTFNESNVNVLTIPVLNINSYWEDSNVTFGADIHNFKTILRASCSIPMIFPPVKMSYNGSISYLSDGAVRMYLPHSMKDDFKDFAISCDFVISSQLFVPNDNEKNVCENVIRKGNTIYSSLMNYQKENFEYTTIIMLYDFINKLLMENSSGKRMFDTSKDSVKEVFEKLKGNFYYIPYIDPMNISRCSTEWNEKDYSYKNKLYLIEAGKKTYGVFKKINISLNL